MQQTGSGDEQAVTPRSIGIAGGHGGLGGLFQRLFAEDGLTVLISDRNTTLRNADLAADCDLCLVAVPLQLVPEVVREMAPYCRPDSALVSLGSLMEPAAEAIGSCSGEFGLVHPLFGPGIKSLQGAPLPHAALRPGPFQRWLCRWLEARGAIIIETTPAQHDRAMAAAQVMLHSSYIALTAELMDALPGDDPLPWTTPTLRMQLALMSRILYQNPHLYGDLIALNAHTPAALDALIFRLQELRRAAATGSEAVVELFMAARQSLGAAGPVLAHEGDVALGEA